MVKVASEVSGPTIVNTDLRLGDVPSPILFDLILKIVIKI